MNSSPKIIHNIKTITKQSSKTKTEINSRVGRLGQIKKPARWAAVGNYCRTQRLIS